MNTKRIWILLLVLGLFAAVMVASAAALSVWEPPSARAGTWSPAAPSSARSDPGHIAPYPCMQWVRGFCMPHREKICCALCGNTPELC